jgi:hypothetical protein
MASFDLKITLGNEAMQSTLDIAGVLAEQALKMSADDRAQSGVIFDDNGNRVGEWSVTP